MDETGKEENIDELCDRLARNEGERDFTIKYVESTDQDRASELVAKMARGESVISLPEIDLTKVGTSTLPLLHEALADGFVTLIKSQGNIIEEMRRRTKE